MYLILASAADEEAGRLAARFPGGECAVLTPGDLSHAGWAVTNVHGPSRFVLGGLAHDAREIAGVLVRLPAVLAPELVQIEEEDREYAAAEMTAFLRYWLTALRCPVFNAPNAMSLGGPIWRPEQWTLAAAAVGLPVEPLSRSTSPAQEHGAARPSHWVTIVDGNTVEDECSALREPLCALARRAGAVVLAVSLTESPGGGLAFAGASPFPRLSSERAADMLAAAFRRHASAGVA